LKKVNLNLSYQQDVKLSILINFLNYLQQAWSDADLFGIAVEKLRRDQIKGMNGWDLYRHSGEDPWGVK
jgi:hypothetical protein